MRLKIIAAASSAERRFSSWTGGSILASLVSYPYVCGKYFKNVCGCDHVSDSVHVTVFVAICLCVGGVVQLCSAFRCPTSFINKLSLPFMAMCVVLPVTPFTLSGSRLCACGLTSDALHTVWFLTICM